MSAAIVQYVFRPNPGCELSQLVSLIKEAATMWRDHGAEVRLWSVQVGEVGNLAFTAGFESTAKLGATLEALNNDQAFAAWRAKNLKAGLATWVRSNQAYEIII
jgi:hypothetical protein